MTYPINMAGEKNSIWEKLSIDLEKLKANKIDLISPLIFQVEAYITNEAKVDWLPRKIEACTGHLLHQCLEMSELERLEFLNKYFFNEKNFRPNLIQFEEASPQELFLTQIFDSNFTTKLPISLLYLHFAYYLDIPMTLTNLDFPMVVKWVRRGSPSFINLCAQGAILSEEEILHKLTHCKTSEKLDTKVLDGLSNYRIFISYCEALLKAYQRQQELRPQLKLLNIILKLNPSNIKYIAERARIFKILGCPKEALSDIKRYFSFVGRSKAPADLKMAYFELQAFSEAQAEPQLVH